jgi:hypothetical protein
VINFLIQVDCGYKGKSSKFSTKGILPCFKFHLVPHFDEWYYYELCASSFFGGYLWNIFNFCNQNVFGGGGEERGFLAHGDRRKGLQLVQRNFWEKGPNVAIVRGIKKKFSLPYLNDKFLYVVNGV